MNKTYEKLNIVIRFLEEEIVRTSMVDDAYDDDYRDPNIDFHS